MDATNNFAASSSQMNYALYLSNVKTNICPSKLVNFQDLPGEEDINTLAVHKHKFYDD